MTNPHDTAFQMTDAQRAAMRTRASETLLDRLEDSLRDHARDAAQSAATWVELTETQARQIIDDVDPAILDYFENSPLSGEWADGLNWDDILQECIADADIGSGWAWHEGYRTAQFVTDDIADELCTVWQDAYDDQFATELDDAAMRTLDETLPAGQERHGNVWVRFASSYPWEAEQMTWADIWCNIADAINRHGQGLEYAATLSVSLAAEDCNCDDHENTDETGPRRNTACVNEYPDYVTRGGFTTDGTLCIWVDRA